MAGVGRNLSLAALMAVLVAIAAVLLPSATWACALAVVLALAGVVLFRGNGWRTGALLTAAVALGLVVLDAFAGLLTPTPYGQGLVRTFDPQWWPPPDPVVGFRPAPHSEVTATATYDGQPIYRRTYHFDKEGGRVTTPATANTPDTDLYLFLGDSFAFGQGLNDDETLASQFVKANDGKVRAINLGVPGYGPNHLVHMFEAGLMDRYIGQPVKAVITWIIPAQLARVTGDGTWLGSSPRYELDDGKLTYTGSFDGYRFSHPLALLRYHLGLHFAFVDAIGMKQRQEQQIDLFVAMLARLQHFAREKFNAPLIVVYSWPDESTRAGYGSSEFGQPVLVDVLKRLRALGIQLVSVDKQASPYKVDQLLIPYDGHPALFTNQLMAKELKRELVK
jgi:hypothetical protein